MKLALPLVWLVVAAGAAHAAFPHSGRGLDVHSRHARLNQRHEVDANLSRRDSKQRRCKQRPTSTASAEAAPPTSKAPAETTQQPAKSSPPAQQNSATSKPSAKPSSSKAAPPPPKETSPAPSSAQTSGLLKTVFPQCGANGAIPNITPLAGPNGAEEFLNCGVESGGWNPPPVQISDLVTMDLSVALKDPNSPFKNCQAYVSLFEQYGQQTGIPAIFLASIAMQESSCDPNKTGGAGEQGLMQITKDKCGAAPNGDCKTPWYNIMTGAEFLASLLKDNGGNVLKSVGQYNGWSDGLTVASATAIASTCCPCQNNLDYLTQFVNGWLLNRDPTASPRIGKYFNLDKCHEN